MRIKSMEGIRGVAAVMVFMSHLVVMFYPAAYWGGYELSHSFHYLDIVIGQSPLSVVFAGNSAVMLFFMLTGFGTYFVYKKGTEAVIKFATLRFVKLIIPIIFSCFVVYALDSFGLTFYKGIIESTKTPWLGDFPRLYTHFFKVFLNTFQESVLYNNTLWTMSYIFKGSFFVLVVQFIWGQISKRYYIYVGVVLILVNLQEIYYIPFLLGLFLADIYDTQKYKKINIPFASVLLIFSIYFLGVPTYMKSEFLLYKYLFTGGNFIQYYHIIGAFLISILTLYWKPAETIMKSKPVQYLGRYSMSIYMIHYPILISFSSWIFLRLLETYNYTVSVFLTFGLSFLLVFLLAPFFQNISGFLTIKFDKLYDKCLNDFDKNIYLYRNRKH